MGNASSPPINTLSKQLSQLTLIRTILLVVLWLIFFLALEVEQIKILSGYLSSTLLVFSVIHILTFLRLKNSLTVTQFEFLIQLFIDVACLSILFYFSGGANNPFISYLLIPICISATTLPWRYTWSITITCLISYTLLLFFYINLPIFEASHHQKENTNWHIIGMWFNFSLSAILITYFIVKMARTLQEQNKTMAVMREDELRNQQLMAVAMLAAGAAHEMNTPLSTMTVLLTEIQAAHKGNPQLQADLEILKSQVKQCANTLRHLVKDSTEANEGKFKQQTIKIFCDSIVNRWQLMRPNVNFTITFHSLTQNTIAHDPRLDQAIINLLNNAADASPEQVELKIHCEQGQLVWNIIDSGKGISNQIGIKLGKIMLSTKEQGLGIGLLLAHAAIKHYGGSVKYIPAPASGTITELRLPLVFS